MRLQVCSGMFKSREIKVSKGVRPFGVVLRKSVFDSAQTFIEESVVLDLFAGSGIMGLEAIGRGAKFAYFVDHSHRSISTVKENANKLRVTNFKAFKKNAFSDLSFVEEPIDIAFVDPPYNQKGYSKILSLLANKLSSQGHVYIKAHKKENIDIPPEFVKCSQKQSGSSILLHVKKLL